MNTTGCIQRPITKKDYNTRAKVTCISNNLIYCLNCLVCDKQYIGQTKRQLVDRLREHFRNINQWRDTQLVERHYNLPEQHRVKSMEIYVLNFSKFNPHGNTSWRDRLVKEYDWMHRLRCFIPSGLNLMEQFDHHN